MIRPEECAVVIPCLNEQSAIFSVVESVRRFIPKVIVVDDGSSDQTAALAIKAGAEAVQHDVSRGKGAALDSGWRRAQSLGYKWVFSMDGDGQHLAEDFPGFLNVASEKEADLVVGNRFANPGQIPWLRRQVNRYMSNRLSQIAGQTLADSQCGFRLMRIDAWSKLTLRTHHFEIESEMLLEFADKGCVIQFVPIQVIYGSEQSKIHPLRDTIRWFNWLRNARRNC